MTPVISVIIFSCDRALQLDATLRSFFRHCTDSVNIPIYILYKVSSEAHTTQYIQLIENYRENKNVHFFHEKNFRKDTLHIISLCMDPCIKTSIYRWTIKLGYRFKLFSKLFLAQNPGYYLTFLVDDNIFVRDFLIKQASGQLEKFNETLGFSLRLGRNTTYCYMQDRTQPLPDFEEVTPGILAYDWQTSQMDFNHVPEVSSSIYRIKDIFPAIHFNWFVTPNQLETCLVNYRPKMSDLPKFLCYETSVTFCNPINKVQEEFLNRSSQKSAYSADNLSVFFGKGSRIDVATYDGFIPNSCHQEMPLRFISSPDIEPIT
jgi:hypothetical protein